MKGHLGFPCRVCRTPGPVQNLGQSGNGFVGDYFQATLAWSAPADVGGGPITEYRVESSTLGGAWQLWGTTNPATLSIGATWCQPTTWRVLAKNRCGYGSPAGPVELDTTFGNPTRARIFTGSGTFMVPCWATSATAYAIGSGGQSSNGGGGGGLVWKTWTRGYGTAQLLGSCVVKNSADANGPALTSVTIDGTTITAFAASASEAGGFSGGDGGAYGNPPGQGNTSFSAAGISYSGTYYWGGSIGGGDPGAGGTTVRPSPVSPCQRQPARDRNDLLARVALAGGKATEDCGVQAAFGSGGVRVPYSAYGSANQYFAPGYGGGGFDSTCPAGPGAVVVYFN